LADLRLNNEILDIIRKNDDAYQFVAWFISQGESSMSNRITRLNGLVGIVKGLKG